MKHKHTHILPRERAGVPPWRSLPVIAAAQIILLGLGAVPSRGQEGFDNRDLEPQVLTRGPVHEAFAEIVSYNPEPGTLVDKAPPVMIEELPPEIRPEGDNIQWIPGYWGWDDERGDHLWVSGTWRALPPGRQWTSGYWGQSGQSYQWISGYWADSSVQEVTYLPKPPLTVEAGPNVEAPTPDHRWTPGSWMWRQERYAWQPGYWAQGRADWDWIPSHYVWTPRGHVFVEGYWDYSFERRGVLYAPVYFEQGYRSRPGYSYSPSIAIDIVALVEHLFLRPNYHHYYFGDYYDRRYQARGYHTPFGYQSSRHGYDPIYSYRRWTNRHDRDWERRYEASYDYRRNHEPARPAWTWADQRKRSADSTGPGDRQSMIAAPLEEIAKRREMPVRIEPVVEKERIRIRAMAREVDKSREMRKAMESEGVETRKDVPEREIKATKVRRPESPIVGKPPDRFDDKQAPPKPQRAPDPDPRTERSDPRTNDRNHRPQREVKSERERPEPRKPERERPETSKPERGRPETNKPERERPETRKPEREQPETRKPDRKPKPERPVPEKPPSPGKSDADEADKEPDQN